jgi:hypothetical protein
MEENDMKALIDGVETLFCKACYGQKPTHSFHKDSSSTRGYAYYCKPCATEKSRVWHTTHKHDVAYKAKRQDSYFKTKYSVSKEIRDQMLVEQDNKCAICRVSLSTDGGHTHTDHNHQTGKIRGILCTNCNRGLGHFKDSGDNLQAAIEYLRKSI